MASTNNSIKSLYQGLSTQAKVEFALYIVSVVLTLVGYFVQRKNNPTMATFISVIFIPIFIGGPLYIYLINCLSKGRCEKLSWLLVVCKMVPVLLLLVGSFLTFSGDVIGSTIGSSFKSL